MNLYETIVVCVAIVASAIVVALFIYATSKWY